MTNTKALLVGTITSLLASVAFGGQQANAGSAPLAVAITLAPTLNDGKIEGNTNLPDGTQMQASLQPPLATCRPNCGYAWEGNLTMTKGRFAIGPLNLARGVYTLEITTPIAELEPATVRAIIGPHGENLMGPYVKAELVPGGGPTIEMTANVTISGSHNVQNPAPAQVDEEWRARPGEVYLPSTYCNWNRTGLPAAQQKICLDYDRKNLPKVYRPKPGEVLTTLIPSCQIGGAISCNDDLFQKVWLRIEADNGEVTKIDMNSVAGTNVGGAVATIYTYVPNTMFDPSKLRNLVFDCAGHYEDVTNMPSALLDAPPRSVVGRISALACSGAKDTRLEDANKDDGRGRTPAEYCVGFSPDACGRIRKVVEAKIQPAFCKPGFGLVGSGLTAEQLRICYVMTSPTSR